MDRGASGKSRNTAGRMKPAPTKLGAALADAGFETMDSAEFREAFAGAALLKLPHLLEKQDGGNYRLRARDWHAATLALIKDCAGFGASPVAAQNVPEIAEKAQDAYSGDWYLARNIEAVSAASVQTAADAERGFPRSRANGYRTGPDGRPYRMSAAERSRYDKRVPPQPALGISDSAATQSFPNHHPELAAGDDLQRQRSVSNVRKAFERGEISPADQKVFAEFPIFGINATTPNPFAARERAEYLQQQREEAEFAAAREALQIPARTPGQPHGTDTVKALKPKQRGRRDRMSDRIAAELAKRLFPLIFGNVGAGERAKIKLRIAEWFLKTAEPERFDKGSKLFQDGYKGGALSDFLLRD